jgi:hypothetical protein
MNTAQQRLSTVSISYPRRASKSDKLESIPSLPAATWWSKRLWRARLMAPAHRRVSRDLILALALAQRAVQPNRLLRGTQQLSDF